MFRFAHPEALWLLLLIPLLIALLAIERGRRKRRIAKLGNREAIKRLMPYTSAIRFWVRSIFMLIAFIFVVLAYAQPQFGLRETRQKRKGSEIMVVLDISKSMLAQDVKPNRLARAKLEISKLVSDLKNDRIGLILFAGKSYVQLPITSDYAAAQVFLQQVSTDMIADQGTSLADALELAARSFSPNRDVGKAIVVISDGESHEDNPLAVAKALGREGIRIFTVGIGSAQGAPVPDIERGGLKKDQNGQVVMSRLDEKTLTEVAAATGGTYLRATNYQAGLQPIKEAIDNMDKADLDQVVYSSYDEQFQPMLWVALIFMLISLFMLERRIGWFHNNRKVARIFRRNEV